MSSFSWALTPLSGTNIVTHLNCSGDLVLSWFARIGSSGLKCHILVTQSPKYTRLKRITNQFSFLYTVVKSLHLFDILTSCKLIASVAIFGDLSQIWLLFTPFGYQNFLFGYLSFLATFLATFENLTKNWF